MLSSNCFDSNYKIRIDAVDFFRQYFKLEGVINHPRFKSTHLPSLIEMINDVDALIRIEAIEVSCDVLEHTT